jgi:hypothetical protein
VEGIEESIAIQANLGREALQGNNQIPKKSSKKHRPNERERAYTKRLTGKRVVIEHINAKIKTFKVTAYP